MLEKVYQISELNKTDNRNIKDLEERLKKLATIIHAIIDNANMVFDIKGLPV